MAGIQVNPTNPYGVMQNQNGQAGQFWNMLGGNPQSGVAQINTSIQPRNIFTPQMTATATNQAVADSLQQASMPYALKQTDRPGVSRSASSVYRALPKVAQAHSDAAMQSAGIPLADEAANQQNMLRGQIAQGQEFNQLARLLLGNVSLGNWQQQQNMAGIGSLLGAFGSLI